MKKSVKGIIPLLVAFMLSSLFFIGLYLFNNKYTHDSIQPAEGLLALTAEEVEDNPIRYLVNGWTFYPGVLLSSEDFKHGNPDNYGIDTSIGEYTHFDNLNTKENPHGCGTYVLRMKLPKGTETYGLDLPTIYSAYRIYINDRLYLEMGSADKDSYQPITQRRLITFDADSTATIVLAVSDYSHFYSGLVYPPAFGTPLALNSARALDLSLYLLVGILGLIAGMLALYAGIRMKHKNALLYAIICFALCCFTSYALLHIYVALPIFPWGTLELISGYVLALLVVIIHNRICDVEILTGRIAAGIAGLFCFAALCYGLFSPQLTIPIMNLFSDFSFMFKAFVAGYLLSTAWLSAKKSMGKTEPLLYASVFYAGAFLWDRIFPNFEPIFFGWFSEWGSIALIIAMGYTLWRDIVSTYSQSLAFAEEHRQVTRQLTMQIQYTRQLALHSEENKRLIHDFRQHLRTITGLAVQIKERDDASEIGEKLLMYLEEISQNIRGSSDAGGTCFSQNSVVDALLQYYYTVAEQNNIDIDFHFTLPQLTLTDVELCTILGNLLENAVEACTGMTQGERKIRVLTENTGWRLLMRIDNTFDHAIRQKEGRFLSSKRKDLSFGIGLESVREIVERHGGDLLISPTSHGFSVGLSLPIRREETQGNRT